MGKFVLVLLICLALYFPNNTSAHGSLPDYFLIDGQYPVANPIQELGVTAEPFTIAQDLAKGTFLVNTPIQFEINEEGLTNAFVADDITHMTYEWDFWDGKKIDGLSHSYTYSTVGTKIITLKILIHFEDTNDPPVLFIDSFLLHVLPTPEYVLPVAKITVQSKELENELLETIQMNLQKPIEFSAERSTTHGDGETYLWSFGDGNTSKEKRVSHQYPLSEYQTVVLRVTDANGFFSDGYVALRHDPLVQEVVPAKQKNLYVPILVVLLLSGTGIAFFLLRKPKMI